MATHRVDRAFLYIGPKLIAEVTNVTITINTNNEQGHGTDGSNYYSKGNPVVDTSFDTVKPAAGYSAATLETAVINQDTDVELVVQIGDKVLSTEGTFTSAEYKGDMKTGMLNGSFKHAGGTPTFL
jgi:hypothetical protein